MADGIGVLTNQQLAHFDTFGFLYLREAFSAIETQEIVSQADALWDAAFAEEPGANEVCLIGIAEITPRLTELVEDDRIYQPMIQLLGEDFIWSGSEAINTRAHRNVAHHWHADRWGSAELSYPRIKIMMYLAPTRRDEGALRVIPGSHRDPLHSELQDFQGDHVGENPTFFGLHGSQIPSYALESEPGDLVIFSQSLFHGVYGKQPGRRYLAFKFAARPTTDQHLASLRRFSGYALNPVDAFLESDCPRIAGMVAGLAEQRTKAENLVKAFYPDFQP